ncbi:MAG: AgmX/PglI C-terminal domain-containing protein [Halobacteriovoraceae bacterium]|nr:AgmX/PglI C-terminal domain-containing protein [Halobacteriovoraceae bacterium]
MDAQESIYEIKGLSKSVKVQSKPLTMGRYLIGSIDSCDVQISERSVEPIHAVLEITPSGTKIYSLTEVGVLVNGEKKTVSDLKKGDTLKIGSVVLDFNEFEGAVLPTVPLKSIPKQAVKSKTQSVITEESVSTPYIIYPYDQEFNFDTSEYIFEDNKNIYPIFKYEHHKQSVEVIIVFQRRIFSVDYLPAKDSYYKLAGIGGHRGQVEYPYLGPKDVVDFIECKAGGFFVNKLPGYSVQVFSNTPGKEKGSSIVLDPNDIVSFQNGDLSIVVRNVEAPPHVKHPPVLPRDKSYLLTLLFFLFLTSLPLYYLYNHEVDRKEVEKEKAPERIARILYDRKPMPKIEEKKPTPKKVEKQPTKVVEKAEKKPEVKKVEVKKAPGPKIPQKNPPKVVKKGQPPKKVVEKKPTPAPPKPKVSRPTTNVAKSPGKSRAKTTTASPTPKSTGTVDVFKSANFKSTISNLLAKGGQFQGARTKGTSGGSQSFQGVQGTSGSSGVTTSNISDAIGSPTGSRTGVEGFKSGAEGLTGTKTFYTAGIPSETVIIGSMDPDIIRKILRDHIPQFRFCYQKELDSTNRKVQGLIKMVFTIGASGSVSKAGVQGSSTIPAAVKSCVVNVLYGIQFPKPLGGGTVEVKQPINFYPRNN